jgi:hypothetical protein
MSDRCRRGSYSSPYRLYHRRSVVLGDEFLRNRDVLAIELSVNSGQMTTFNQAASQGTQRPAHGFGRRIENNGSFCSELVRQWPR